MAYNSRTKGHRKIKR